MPRNMAVSAADFEAGLNMSTALTMATPFGGITPSSASIRRSSALQ